MLEKDNVELRSEKMRNIIGEIPSWLVRVGSAVIVAVITVIIVCMCLIRPGGRSILSFI